MGFRNRHRTAHAPGSRFPLVACAGLGVIALLGAACGSSAPPKQAVQLTTPQRGVPSGYTEFRDSVRGYSIALPSTWVQINVQSAQAAAVFARALRADPKIAAVFGANLVTLQKENMSLLAVAPSGAGANMIANTSVDENLSEVQLAALVPTVVAEYARAGMSVSGHKLVTVDGHPAIRFQTSITLKGHTVHETQFVLVTGGWSYALTIDQASAGTTAEIVSTLRFGS
jgi:hypothetical protein